MQLPNSNSTTRTKISLITKPTQFSQRQISARVFIDFKLKSYSVVLPLDCQSVNEIIEKALREFEVVHNISLAKEKQRWELYACKVNGRRINDFPSLDPTQIAQATGFNCFYLCPQNQITRASSSSSSNSSKIMTDFKKEHKKEIKVKESKPCLCFNI